MKTKLVYVLTCAEKDTYIEQALMSVWSARYHNPDTPIVLVVDNETDKQLTGNRAEILNYVSDKVVVPFEDDKNMHYRSRWLKTKVRELVIGDYLYVDCDTIITCDLSHIEEVDAEMAMIRDGNLDIEQYCTSMYDQVLTKCQILDLDMRGEKYYFNGGIIYAKDTTKTHQLYKKWHTYWLDGLTKGLNIDQPAFAKANIEMNHLVALLPDRWNVFVGSQIEEIYSAYILHFAYTPGCVFYLFSSPVLAYVQKKGLTDFIKYYILHPTYSLIPANNHVYNYRCKDYRIYYHILSRTLKEYGQNVDATFTNLKMGMRMEKRITKLLRKHMYTIAAMLIVLEQLYKVKLSGKYIHYTNSFSKKG